MDTERLHSDIKSHLQDDPTPTEHLNHQSQSDPKWTLNPDGLLQHSRCIYVLETGNLRLRVLQYSHDHPLAGHFGQTKTLHAIRMHYYWPGLQAYVKNYCNSCTTCSHCHEPYFSGTLTLSTPLSAFDFRLAF